MCTPCRNGIGAWIATTVLASPTLGGVSHRHFTARQMPGTSRLIAARASKTSSPGGERFMNRKKLRQIHSQTPGGFRRTLVSVGVACVLGTAASMLVATSAEARLTKLQILGRTTAFGGYSFAGDIGTYEKIYGKYFGELNPNDPRNAVIADIALAPRNANGNVEYSADFYILKPTDLTKGAHKAMYEPPNRGGKTYGTLNRTSGNTNDPAAITDGAMLAQSFLWARGYTTMWTGWDFAAGTDNSNFVSTITVPVAKNADGTSITGPAYEYIVSPGASYALNYPAATMDQSKAVLTHRVHLDDTPAIIPASGWAYNAAGTAITLLPAGTSFTANDVYEFTYIAKDPLVNGIGFAAVRDFNSFMRYATADDSGTPNPMAGDITRIYTEISSQPGRMLNDFVNLGFNGDENNKLVFDGLMQWVAAFDGIDMNYRFSQSGRTERNRQDHLYAEGNFPFAQASMTDPISGKTAGRYDRCSATSTCPFGMEIYSANEYWVKAGSLGHTDPMGKVDLPDYPKTRNYLVSSHQHGGAGNASSKGLCQQFGNPLNSAPIQRALFIALDQWADQGVKPPPSQVPKLSDGTLVPPMPQSGQGFPSIPGVTYTGLKSTRYLLNWGSRFGQGIKDNNPPTTAVPLEDNPAIGAIYPSYVPKTDSDGNDIAGIRLPDVTVPLATYAGWALRSGVWANDGCEGSGMSIPFAQTQAARVAAGDPRPSIEERYGNFSFYYYKLLFAINDMVGRRFMLPEDASGAFNTGLQKVLQPGSALIPKSYELPLLLQE
jgi:Alpha/beta hydrolase domain